MFVVTNRLYIEPDWAERFEERFRQRIGKINKQDGFVRMQVLKPAKRVDSYQVVTTWRDQSAFKGWVGSEDFEEAHQNPLPKDAYSREGNMEQHEVIIHTEV